LVILKLKFKNNNFKILVGFATAFSTDENEDALKFFEKYGIVVFKDVLTKQEQNGNEIDRDF